MALKQETQIIELPIYKGGNYFHKGGNYFHKGGNNNKKEQFIIRRKKNKGKTKRNLNKRNTKKRMSKKYKSAPN